MTRSVRIKGYSKPISYKLKEEEEVFITEREDCNSEFICPIGLSIMENPVLATCGHSYDKQNIENWLRTSEICPECRTKINAEHLIPNYSLRSVIQKYVKEALKMFKSLKRNQKF